MRSDLVFGHFLMCPIATSSVNWLARQPRKLHKPNTRLQDTTNEVLCRFQTANPGTVGPVAAPAAQPVERAVPPDDASLYP